MAMAKSIFPKAIYLSAPTRTPIGKYGGTLKRFTAPQLATLALKEAITRLKNAGGNANTDLVVLGHARQAGAGPNTARQATIFSGLPENIPAFTVNQACASGLTSIISASEKISLGKAHSAWAGGTESMSNTPYFLMDARWGMKMGNGEVVDGMRKDGFFCPMSQMLMGETVENFLVPECNVSRIEQDQFALQSQQKAAKAWTSGAFKPETFEIPAEGRAPALAHDEHARADTSMESLAKLPAVFNPKTGSISAGNSSGITDGAAILHVGLEKNSATYVELLDYEIHALDPRHMGLGPVAATQNLLKRQGLTVNDIEAYEVNEAFAAQVIACQRTLKLPEEKVNQRGGSIALGHPIGATGARIAVTLAHILSGKPGALGVATLCVSGGMGVSILLRSVK